MSARKLGLEFVKHAESLNLVPSRGKVYPKYGNGKIREVPYLGYRIFYKIFEDVKRIDILLVWHGSRDEPRSVLHEIVD